MKSAGQLLAANQQLERKNERCSKLINVKIIFIQSYSDWKTFQIFYERINANKYNKHKVGYKITNTRNLMAYSSRWRIC